MKRILFALAFILFLGSCKKSASSIVAGISYKVNGTHVQISGGIDSSQWDNNTGYYYGCYAVNPNSSNYYAISGESKTEGALLIISTPDHLSATTYSTGLVSVSFNIDNTPYGINSGDSITVKISRYSNGTIDGTFSAIISDANANKKTITDGRLNNIKVYP
jgi:hypothetical protein